MTLNRNAYIRLTDEKTLSCLRNIDSLSIDCRASRKKCCLEFLGSLATQLRPSSYSHLKFVEFINWRLSSVNESIATVVRQS